MFTESMKTGGRNIEQLRQHYEVERELANRLRCASRSERRGLYGRCYDELYKRVPHHPRLRKAVSAECRQARVRAEMKFLSRFLRPNGCFAEIGAGDCAVSIQIAKSGAKVYAIDVSAEIPRDINVPQSFALVLTDGVEIPLPETSVDTIYSNQLMEHLHPEDAVEQLNGIFRALKPGGVYVCCTPNRLNGPHDISKFFDHEATGFHLKEYTVTELASLFQVVGFSTIRTYVGVKNTFFVVPLCAVVTLEAILSRLPAYARRRVANIAPFRQLLGIRMAAWK